jgi:hypothetical protein
MMDSTGVDAVGAPDLMRAGAEPVARRPAGRFNGRIQTASRAKLLTGQGGAGEFVHQQVMGMLDGTGLLAVPSDQVETAAALGVRNGW